MWQWILGGVVAYAVIAAIVACICSYTTVLKHGAEAINENKSICLFLFMLWPLLLAMLFIGTVLEKSVLAAEKTKERKGNATN